MNLIKRSSLSILFVFTALTSLFSQNIEWVGSGNPGIWEDENNWDPVRVPIPTDDVEINGVFTITVASTSTIETLRILGGASVTIATGYTLTVEDTGNDGVELEDAGTSLTVNGTLISTGHGGNGVDINGGGSLTVNMSGTINIHDVGSSGKDGLSVKDNMTNAGTITITNPGKSGIRMEGSVPGRTISNSGSITISGGVFGIDMKSDNWLFTNTSTGTVTLSNASSALISDGTNFTNYGLLKGDGLIENGNFMDVIFGAGSTIAPGTSVGKLTFEETVDFTNIDIDIEINGATNYDQIVVKVGTQTNGDVTLTGASLNLSGGYIPVGTESFLLIEKESADPITGTFAGLPEGATVNFNGSSFIISYLGGDGNDVGMLFDNPLPVELIDFSAQAMENEINLTWTTATETNNDFFTIERSPDGRTFEAIATVFGNGTTTEISNYSHVDKNPLPGLNYYRLKQTDFDGQFSYSDIKTAEINYDEVIKVYPTVVTGMLTIEIGDASNENKTILIRDLTGREYRSFPIPSRSNKTELSLEDLIPGIYFVVVSTDTTVYTQKIIKL